MSCLLPGSGACKAAQVLISPCWVRQATSTLEYFVGKRRYTLRAAIAAAVHGTSGVLHLQLRDLSTSVVRAPAKLQPTQMLLQMWLRAQLHKDAPSSLACWTLHSDQCCRADCAAYPRVCQ
jgi:hypothetical protein